MSIIVSHYTIIVNMSKTGPLPARCDHWPERRNRFECSLNEPREPFATLATMKGECKIDVL
jgi:hypothetical protein